MHEGWIYRITCDQCKKTYIGCTKGPVEHRWSAHASALRKGTHANQNMQRCWGMHGQALTVETMEGRSDFEDPSDIYDLESAWMSHEQSHYTEGGMNIMALPPNPVGFSHPNATLDEETVAGVKVDLASGMLPIEVQEKYGIPRSRVSAIRHIVSWSHVRSDLNDAIRSIEHPRGPRDGCSKFANTPEEERAMWVKAALAAGEKSIVEIAGAIGLTAPAVIATARLRSWANLMPELNESITLNHPPGDNTPTIEAVKIALSTHTGNNISIARDCGLSPKAVSKIRALESHADIRPDLNAAIAECSNEFPGGSAVASSSDREAIMAMLSRGARAIDVHRAFPHIKYGTIWNMGRGLQ